MSTSERIPLPESQIEKPERYISLERFLGPIRTTKTNMDIHILHYLSCVLAVTGSSCNVFGWSDKTYCMFYGSDRALENITPETIRSSYFRFLNNPEFLHACFVLDDGKQGPF